MPSSITRIFHPIGQGAFYSERHGNFNIVYDCGEWKNTLESDFLVQNSFYRNSVIDILFISHFDFDHVSKIDILKKSFHIKTCILPLLHKEQKKLLERYYQSQDQTGIADLIDDPQKYFGNETKIIFIKPVDNDEHISNIEERYVNGQHLEYTSLESSQKVNSDTVISISDNWIYIPYNINYSQRNAELKTLFQNAGLDIDKFKDDTNYGIENRNLIKKVYKKLKGGINYNSMLLYSGPSKEDVSWMVTDCICCSKYGLDNHICHNDLNYKYKPACIFTGDADLNKTDIKKIFYRFWKYVGTIQIPHHGDSKSFDVLE